MSVIVTIFSGSWFDVSSISSRLVYITIFLATLFIYAYYTSALVAQLTVASEASVGFTTLQGFAEDGGYQLGFMKGTSLENEFKVTFLCNKINLSIN